MKIEKEEQNWVIKIPTQQSIDDKLLTEIKFHLLAEKWYEEVKFFSFAQQRENDTYQAILAMGETILPFILKELEKGKNLWFSALKKLSNHNPVQAEHKGKPQLMAKDWLDWAKTQNFS